MGELERIRRWCGVHGQLWQDPDFPAAQPSVFYHQTPPFTFQWRRPRELSARPQLVVHDAAGPMMSADTVTRSGADIAAGKMGDRWLVSCLGVLHHCKGLFYRVVPADQGFEPERGYCGAFRFRVWWCGEWTEVIVDDRLPAVNGRLAFLQPVRSDQYWAPLLEKALAKLHGSYEALKYGTLLDGLADMTGGVAEAVALPTQPQAAVRAVRRLLDMQSVVTCAPVATAGQQLTERTANWRVLAADEAADTVKLADPLGGGADGGEVTLSAGEWRASFPQLDVVHLDADTARDEPSLRGARAWHTRLYHGRWRRGASAGGCRNNPDTFHVNPQLVLTVSPYQQLATSDEQDATSEPVVVVSLNQHSVTEPRVIGFTAYRLAASGTGEQFGRQWFKKNKSLVNSQYTNSRQVSHRWREGGGGELLLVPTTFEPGQECGFTVRVLCARSLKMRALDTAPRQVRAPVARAPPPEPAVGTSVTPAGSSPAPASSTAAATGFSQYEAVFLQLADEQRTVNAFELQELLDACLPNDYIKSCASLEVCRLAVAALGGPEAALTGRLRLPDFRDLMCSLKQWQGVFKAHAREKTGILKAERLRDALLDVGFQLDTDTLAALVTRHVRKDGTLRFGDFVAMVLQLTHAFRAFHTRDPARSGTARLLLADWLRASLAC